MQVSQGASDPESNRRIERMTVGSRKIYRLYRKKVPQVVKTNDYFTKSKYL